jgi:hypothetical protein
MYIAEYVFELLSSLEQKLTLGHLIEVQKQNGPESVPETKERTMTVFKLNEGLGLIEVEVFEDTETCTISGSFRSAEC